MTRAFEIECYRRSLGISCKDHVINEDVRKKIQAVSEKYERFDRVLGSSSLAGAIQQGTVQGKRS